MCLLIYKPKDAVIPYEKLSGAFENNGDGAGFAYIKDGKVVTEKYQEFFEFYKNLQEKTKGKQAIVHFRFATSGLVDTINCHPFIVGKKDADVKSTVGDKAIAHNGVLSKYVKPGNYSDTFHFVKHYAKLDGVVKKEDIEKLIGGGNKLVTLDKNGVYHIYNEDLGHWIDGVWYSNRSYEKYKYLYRGTSAYYQPKGATYDPYNDDVFYDDGCVSVKRDLHLIDENGKMTILKKGEYYIENLEDDADFSEFTDEDNLAMYGGWR